MKVYDAASIRNVALVGHTGSGKTQLASAILSDAGMVNRFGKVDDGTTVTDYDEEEIARKHTLSASLAYAEWNKTENQSHRHAGHRQLPERRARGAPGRGRRARRRRRRRGRHGPDRKSLGAAEELGLPRLVVVNRLDRERASLERSLQSLRDTMPPHRHSDSAPDRRGESVPRRRRSRDEEGVHLPARRKRQVRRKRTFPADMTAAVDAAARSAHRDGRGSRRSS